MFTLRGLYLRIKALWISFKDRKSIHLMDDVIYKRKMFVVNNANTHANDGTRLFDIYEKQTLPDEVVEGYLVPEDELVKARTWFNFHNGLLYHYKWYMLYWYNIDLREANQNNI